MAYTKTTWATGDTITADKLNNIENGVENASDVFLVHTTAVYPVVSSDSVTSDKTYTEISVAIDAGQFVAMIAVNDYTAFGQPPYIMQYHQCYKNDDGGIEFQTVIWGKNNSDKVMGDVWKVVFNSDGTITWPNGSEKITSA